MAQEHDHEGIADVKTVLSFCINTPQQIKDALRVAQKLNVISSDVDLGASEDSFNAVESMLSSLSKHSDWGKIFSVMCHHEEFPVDRQLREVLLYIAQKHDSNVRFLIDSWESMESCRKDILQCMNRRYPTQKLDETASKRHSWQVYLLHNCTIMEEETATQLVKDIKQLLPEPSTELLLNSASSTSSESVSSYHDCRSEPEEPLDQVVEHVPGSEESGSYHDCRSEPEEPLDQVAEHVPGSEESGTIYQECYSECKELLKKLMKHVLGSEEGRTKEFLNSLKKNEQIGEEKVKNLMNEVVNEDGKVEHEVTAEFLLKNAKLIADDSLSASELDMSVLAAVLLKIAKMQNKSITFLTESWDSLDKDHADVKAYMERELPSEDWKMIEKGMSSGKYSWQLYMLHKYMTMEPESIENLEKHCRSLLKGEEQMKEIESLENDTQTVYEECYSDPKELLKKLVERVLGSEESRTKEFLNSLKKNTQISKEDVDNLMTEVVKEDGKVEHGVIAEFLLKNTKLIADDSLSTGQLDISMISAVLLKIANMQNKSIIFLAESWESLDEDRDAVMAHIEQNLPEEHWKAIQEGVRSGKLPWQLYMLHQYMMMEPESIEKLEKQCSSLLEAADRLNKMGSTGNPAHTVEFRAVVGEDLPKWACLHIHTDFPDLKDLNKMEMVKSGQFVFTIDAGRIPETFHYYYCYKAGDNVIDEWPKNDSKDKCLRRVYSKDKDSAGDQLVLYDFVKFQGCHMEAAAFKLMPKHLPGLGNIKVDANHCDISTFIELENWIRCMKHGWKWSDGTELIIESDELQAMIAIWMLTFLDVQGEDGIKRVMLSFFMLRAFQKQAAYPASSAPLNTFCHCLDIAGATPEMWVLLYEYVNKVWISISESVEEPTSSLVYLFKCAESKPIPELIITLPLYWLLHNKGRDCCPSEQALKKSMPAWPDAGGVEVKWDAIKEKCKTSHRDLVLLRLSVEEIQKKHPWIMKAYTYLSTFDTMAEVFMLQDKDGKTTFPIQGHCKELLRRCRFSENRPEKDVCDSYRDVMGLTDRFRRYFSANLTEESGQHEFQIKKLDEILEMLSDILGHLSNASECDLETVYNMVIWCLKMAQHSLEKPELALGHRRTECLMKYLNIVRRWWLPDNAKVDNVVIQYWNDLLQQKWPDEKFSDIWRKALQKRLTDSLEKLQDKLGDGFWNIYVETISLQLDPFFSGLLLKHSLCCLNVMLKKKKNFFARTKYHTQKQKERVASVMTKMFNEELKHIQKDKSVWYILESPVLSIFDSTEEARKIQPYFRKQFAKHKESTSVLRDIVEKMRTFLEEGSVTIADFKKGLEKEDGFMMSLCEEAVPGLNEAMLKCKAHLDSYKQDLALRKNFHQIFASIIQGQYTEKDVSSMQILSLKLLTDAEKAEILAVFELKNMRILEHAIEVIAKDSQAEDSKAAWVAVKKILQKWYHGICNGTIRLMTVAQIFGENDIRTVLNALSKLLEHEPGTHKQINDLREQQIKCCIRIHGSDMVKIQVQIHRKSLRCVNVPSYMTRLIKLTDKNSLNRITEDIISYVESIYSFPNSAELNESLNKIYSHNDLILWLQENCRDINELKVMCDLAMISAGETTQDIHQVSCLLSAAMGFGPLIFDVKKMANPDEFFWRCKEVETNIAADKKLLSKWEQTAQKLPWFKSVIALYGSGEKSTLTEVKNIMRDSTFIIEYDKDDIPELKDCLKLVISPNSPGEKRTKNLDEQRELQAKLSLLASEYKTKDDNIQQFLETVDAVDRLAMELIHLLEAGCMLFRKWNATISSLPGKMDLAIKLSFGGNTKPLTCDGSISDINSLTRVLLQTSERWKNFVREKRMQHYFLNEFSIRQINLLCKELAFHQNGGKLNSQAKLLLVKITGKLLDESAIQHLMSILKVATSYQPSQNEGTQPKDCNETKITDKKGMVRKLVSDHAILEDVAKAAVQSEGFEDEDICLDWALFNEHKKSIVQKLCEEFDKDLGFHFGEKEQRPITTVFQNRENNSLLEVVESLLKNYSVADSAEGVIRALLTVCTGYCDKTMVLTLKDYLSIDHLGVFLAKLRNHKEIPRLIPKRALSAAFNEGSPNIVVGNAKLNTLPLVLSSYMHDKYQPLPTTSEVLICHKETSISEAERFMLRAMCKHEDNGEMIHCLVFTESLHFKVSKAVEQMYEELCKSDKLNPKYRLLIFTSNQKDYLATCFGNHIVPGSCAWQESEVKTYLASKLKMTRGAVIDKKAAANKKALGKEERVMLNDQSIKIVISTRPGVGKSLYIKRMRERLVQPEASTTVRLTEDTADVDRIISKLERFSERRDLLLIHLDMMPVVRIGVERIAFNLLILGSIESSSERVWLRQPNHIYAVEVNDFSLNLKKKVLPECHVLKLLPSIECHGPQRTLQLNLSRNRFVPIDEEELSLPLFQRPANYLKLFKQETHESTISSKPTFGSSTRSASNKMPLENYTYNERAMKMDGVEVTQVLMDQYYVKDPSWLQLRHFASFLNVQLINCEKSVFLDPSIVGADLPGLKTLAVRFMIKMSQDFATPSLVISDESGKDEFQQHQVKRKWEDSSHSYIFFNEDGMTMTFIDVNISKAGHLLDSEGKVEVTNVASHQLVEGLLRQNVRVAHNFKKFSEFDREKKLIDLCHFMGIENCDPDPTFELTTDNVLKIMAMHVRLKCGIPLIVMGETGCGKTRMVEYMCQLKAGGKKDVKNMVTMKIHGGITSTMFVSRIGRKVKEISESRQRENTVLFFDEANTTAAIHSIKELMCDLTIDGNNFDDSKIQFIAACNPYKTLTNEELEKVKKCGLGYAEGARGLTEYIGSVSMRSLVYRVVPLPPTMQKLVWDFGHLKSDCERLYVEQMVAKLGRKLNLARNTVALLTSTISNVQYHMRLLKNECKYVSLRDVERCMLVFEWFHRHAKIFSEGVTPLTQSKEKPIISVNDIRALLLTLAVCYHASLDDKVSFREKISRWFVHHGIKLSCQDIYAEIQACQDIFLKDLKTDGRITWNEALRENVFMITICCELKIPLFLVGKPGSSKSLAKKIVASNMLGKKSQSDLFKELKQVYILSFQCSGLTDAKGIENIFEQCTSIQSKVDARKYTAVVVLDEIGLAEASPKMPLKVLHPLLESGSTADIRLADIKQDQKVGFVGISNWALDPAKMNRGIFVTRPQPSEHDLKNTAAGIFSSQVGERDEAQKRDANMDNILGSLTKAYLEIYEAQAREYFGLRDFYSLIKMVSKNADAEKRNGKMARKILRNFSGGDISPLPVFRNHLGTLNDGETDLSVVNLIRDNLEDDSSRFLLLLTKDTSAVWLLSFFTKDYHIIYGSAFPGDNSYGETCKNISRIKHHMETGKKVVLLNLTEIYESFYDALNQHYDVFGGQRYVDLGLGGNRVKGKVAKGFRLIVIEKKEVVHSQYPIPLINRLEKYELSAQSLLTESEANLSSELCKWSGQFTDEASSGFSKQDVFVGYNDDTTNSIVLTLRDQDSGLNSCKSILLKSATVDSLFRLQKIGVFASVGKTYFGQQTHDNLLSLLRKIKAVHLLRPQLGYHEIASFSNVLSEADKKLIEASLSLSQHSLMVIALQEFNTELEYLGKLDEFIHSDVTFKILLVQCLHSHRHSQLVGSARFTLQNKLKEVKNQNFSVLFLLSTDRQALQLKRSDSCILFQHTKESNICYIDELKPTARTLMSPSFVHNKSIFDVLERINSEYASGDENLRLTSLLENSVCEAVTLIQRYSERKDHYHDQTKALCHIFGDKNLSTSSKKFSEICTQKLLMICRQQEKETFKNAYSWAINAASSKENLLECGSFGKTLWIFLKHKVAAYLAYIVSAVDRYNNMRSAHLFDEQSWQLPLWLNLFKQFDCNWSEMKKTPVIRHLKNDPCLEYPFSFWILDELEAHYKLCLEKDRTTSAMIKYFNSHPAIEVLRNSAEDHFQAFVSDLVKVYFRNEKETVKTEALAVVKRCLLVCCRNYKPLEPGQEFACAFAECRNRGYLSGFLRICAAFPGILKHLEPSEKHSSPLSLLKDAFGNLFSELCTRAEKLRKPADVAFWIELFSVATAIAPLVPCDHKDWKPLCLLYICFIQLLPKTEFNNYAEVILPSVRRLWINSTRLGLGSEKFLIVASSILCTCYDDVHLKELISWNDFKCPHCQNRMKDPLKLSCGHFICKQCKNVLSSQSVENMICPTCAKSLGSFTVPELSESAKHKLGNFQSACTSLLIQCVTRFSLVAAKDAGTKSDALIQFIVRELVIFKGNGEDRKLTTEALDLNIGARSHILCILLQFAELNTSIVTTSIVTTINEALKQDPLGKTKLVVLHCVDYQKRLKYQRMEPHKKWEKLECHLSKPADELFQKHAQLKIFEVIQVAAEIRYALEEYASCLSDHWNSDAEIPKPMARFMRCMERFIKEDLSETLVKFLVKVACQKFGMNWPTTVGKGVIPPAFLSRLKSDSLDYFSMSGDKYSHAKLKLRNCKRSELKDTIIGLIQQNHREVALAIWDWAQMQPASDKDFAVEKVKRAMNLTPLTRGTVTKKSDDDHQKFQLVTLMEVIINSQHDLMDGFRLLAREPGKASVLFLPAMQEHKYFSIPEKLRKQNDLGKDFAYMCPNGHLYLIGNCGRPSWQSECPDCKAPIGGAMHKAAKGNKAIELTEVSQAGYQLNKDSVSMTDPAERISRQGAASIQFMLHASLIIGIEHDNKAVLRLLHVKDLDSAHLYLWNQLAQNLNNLAISISRNRDETVIVLHRILHDIMNSQNTKMKSIGWRSMEERKTWEQLFYKTFLEPVFTNLDATILNALNTLGNAASLSNSLYKFVHEVDWKSDEQVSKTWTDPALWQQIKHYDVDHLLQYIQDRNQGQVLQLLLKSPDLEQVQHLETILSLQKELIRRYENHLDMDRANEITFADLEYGTDNLTKQMVEKYIETWNQLYGRIRYRLPGKLQGYFQKLTSESPISMALPSSRGRGQCAKVLSEYLIETQNKFLADSGINLEEVEVNQLRSSHYVRIDNMKELTPKIQMYMKYDILTDQQGRHHHISYNIDALEKQVVEDFVKNKKRIDVNSLPCMRYPQDIGIGSEWKAVRREQVPLSEKIKQEVEDLIIQLSFPDICETIRSLTYAITYLAKAKPYKPEQYLWEFLANDLLLESDQTGAVPRSTKLKHLLAIFQHLMWHKATEFVRKGSNPYLNYNLGEQKQVADKDNLEKAFQEMQNLEHVQQQINEIILQIPDFLPQWSLQEIVPDFDFLTGDSTNLEYLKKLPEDILYENIVDVFKLAVKYQDRESKIDEERPNKNNIKRAEVAKKSQRRGKMIGPKGGSIATDGCTVSFPPGCLDQNTQISISLSSDISNWPEGYIAVCPILQCEPSGMTFSKPFFVKIATWVSADPSAKCCVNVLHQNAQSKWIKECSVRIDQSREIKFECRHFTPFFIGYVWNKIRSLFGPLTYTVNSHLYQNDKCQIHALLCVDDKIVQDEAKGNLEDAGFRPTLPLPEKFSVKVEDQISVRLICNNRPDVVVRDRRGYTVTIDEEFVTNKLDHREFCLELPDPSSDYALQMTYEVQKVNAGRMKAHPFPYQWIATRHPESPSTVIQNAKNIQVNPRH